MPTSPALLLLARLLLSLHFAAELVDKIVRFEAWTATVAAAGMPLPSAEMALVVALLAIGTGALVTGWRLRAGVVALLVFSVPTALLFESGSGALKLVSICGGLLLLWATGPGPWALGAETGGRGADSPAP